VVLARDKTSFCLEQSPFDVVLAIGLGESRTAMATSSNLDVLRRLRDAVARASELELADLDRRIKELERARPVSHAAQLAGREHMHRLLRVMQQAQEPLPPRELARRLESDARTVSRWLATARRQGYVERVAGARYQVRKEVPPLE
jgi:predicted Rossmann fold nucleotide-binding protein DprA/Smf involved in DNA uptake